jgi:hypothetical protein
MALTMFTMDLVEDKQVAPQQAEQEVQVDIWEVIGVTLLMDQQEQQDKDLAEAVAVEVEGGLVTMETVQEAQAVQVVQEES